MISTSKRTEHAWDFGRHDDCVAVFRGDFSQSLEISKLQCNGILSHNLCSFCKTFIGKENKKNIVSPLLFRLHQSNLWWNWCTYVEAALYSASAVITLAFPSRSASAVAANTLPQQSKEWVQLIIEFIDFHRRSVTVAVQEEFECLSLRHQSHELPTVQYVHQSAPSSVDCCS